MTRERPILFSAPMVRAILAGTKTQTRRVLKAEPPPGAERVIRPFRDERLQWAATDPHDMEQGQLVLGEAPRCPYGQPGDRLWVRETWARNEDQLSETRMDTSLVYRADGETRAQDNGTDLPWRPSIHMPRAASRITLEITGVRVERLQEISTADCWAEGIASSPDVDPVHEYAELWESINGRGSWDANPWVWVLEFRKLERQ